MNKNNNFNDSEAYDRALHRVKRIKGFYAHLASYVLVNIFLLVLIAISHNNSEDFWSFGTFSTPFFWGIGLAFHAFSVFGKEYVFTRDWEQKKIKEYMDKEKKFNNWQ